MSAATTLREPVCKIARRSTRGFTLIELLVVVSIISILSLIAMPNMTLAITRAKISRVRNDMRIVANGLELYMVDHNEYPSDLRVARVVRFNSPINDIFARSKGEFHYETPESPWGVARDTVPGYSSIPTRNRRSGGRAVVRAPYPSSWRW